MSGFVPQLARETERAALDLPVGYHGATFYERLPTGEVVIDDPDPLPPLADFIGVVDAMAAESGLESPVGTAYLRVIDAGSPESLCWHVDNADGAVRFHTALSTAFVPVQLAFLRPGHEGLVGEVVSRSHPYCQPANGEVVAFTVEPHGVLPQPRRPGVRTVVMFSTLYSSREAADLWTTNCHVGGGRHATLPSLDGA